MSRSFVLAGVASLWLLAAAPAHGQQAVVLGAGGSRGLAHAGVLVGLEARGYDPDVVLGASMGAVIGGHYAAGFAADSIWRLTREIDWREMFTSLPLFTGPDRGPRYPVLRTGLGTARDRRIRGIIPEWRINRVLVRHLFDAGVRSGGDFDLLPRRFRAVTTDLETGESVVLATGDLPRAVRASMAVPAVFSPVLWDGRHLVDGGVADYLPVDIARRIGASHVIAADVIRPSERIAEFSALTAGWRAFRLILRNTLDPDEAPDLLVLPEIEAGFSAATFLADPLPLLQAGLAAATNAPPPAPSPPADRAPAPGPPARWTEPAVAETTDPAIAALVRAAFRDVAPGPYDPAAVLRAVDRLYATGLMDGVWPRAEPAPRAEPGAGPKQAPRPQPASPVDATGTGRARAGDVGGSAADTDSPWEATLVVRADARPPTTLLAAAAYDADRGGHAWATLQQRLGFRRPTEAAATAVVARLERRLAGALRVHSLRWIPFVWSGGAHYLRSDERSVGPADGDEPPESDGQPDRARVERVGGWLGGDYLSIAPDWFLSATLLAEDVAEDRRSSGLAAGPLLRLGRVEPLNRIAGGPTELELELRRGDLRYGRGRVRASLPGRSRTGGLLAAVVADATIVGGEVPADVLPSLGHEHLVPGMRWGEERGRLRFVAGGDLARAGPAHSDVRLRLRAGAAVDAVRELDDLGAWAAGAQVALIWSTPAGPLLAGLSANTRGALRLDVRAGPAF